MLEKNKEGKVIKVCKCEKRQMQKKEMAEINLIADYGVEGDVHAGKGHRQISLVGIESVEKIVRERNLNTEEGYCNFAQNITLEGIELFRYPVGTEFKIANEILLKISEIGKAGEENPDNIMLTEGIFAEVLKGGRVVPGDPIIVLE